MAWKDIDSAPVDKPLRLKGKSGGIYAGIFCEQDSDVAQYKGLHIIIGPYFKHAARSMNPIIEMPNKWKLLDD